MSTRTVNRIHVIINPGAGRDEPILNVLNTVLSKAGILWEVSVTHVAGDAREHAKRAISAGFDIVAVYGGDGTVAEAASGMIGSEIPLAILPGGTSNVTSQELAIPPKLEDAIGLLCGGAFELRRVDMGRIGDRTFLGHIGIGIEADMHEAADRSMKDRLGVLAYPLAALRSLIDRPISHFDLVIDGEHFDVDGVDCMITNFGKIGILGASVAPDISFSDGFLDVIVIRPVDSLSLGRLIENALGLPEAAALLPRWRARKVSVSATPPQKVSADGEVVGETPVEISIIPDALWIVTPVVANSAVPETTETPAE